MANQIGVDKVYLNQLKRVVFNLPKISLSTISKVLPGGIHRVSMAGLLLSELLLNTQLSFLIFSTLVLIVILFQMGFVNRSLFTHVNTVRHNKLDGRSVFFWHRIMKSGYKRVSKRSITQQQITVIKNNCQYDSCRQYALLNVCIIISGVGCIHQINIQIALIVLRRCFSLKRGDHLV